MLTNWVDTRPMVHFTYSTLFATILFLLSHRSHDQFPKSANSFATKIAFISILSFVRLSRENVVLLLVLAMQKFYSTFPMHCYFGFDQCPLKFAIAADFSVLECGSVPLHITASIVVQRCLATLCKIHKQIINPNKHFQLIYLFFFGHFSRNA